MSIRKITGKRLPIYIALIAFGLVGGIGCDNASKDSRTIIATEGAPEAIGPYSQGVLAGNTLYAAGQIGLDPATREMAGSDLESQARQALDNLKAVVEASGMSLSHVVAVQVFLTDLDNYSAFNAIYDEYFPTGPPARAVVEVSALPLDAKVEIMLTAVNTE